MNIRTEKPYFDKHGKEIKEFAVLKVFHFIGARRKKHYMYKWVRMVEINGAMLYAAYHLDSGKENNYYLLMASADDCTRQVESAEIVQQYN